MAGLVFWPSKPLIHSSIIYNEKPLQPDYSRLVKISETHTYGVYDPHDSPEAWTRISDVVAGPDGGVFIVDPRTPGVHFLIPGEGVKRSYGLGEGQGPGEYLVPFKAAWDGGTYLFVADDNALRILVFNINGEFERSFTPKTRPYSMAFSGNGSLWITNFFSRPFDRLIQLDMRTGDNVTELGGRYEDAQWLTQHRPESFVNSAMNGLIQGHSYPYELLLYNADGSLMKIIRGEAPWLTPAEVDELGRWIQRNGRVRRPTCFLDGKILVHLLQITGSLFEPQYGGYFDLFESDGMWLTSIPLEVFREGAYVLSYTVSSDGAIWVAFLGDYPTLSRYEIEFLEP